jgi:transcriptional regulator with XRE-family HTH domain
LQAVTKLKLRRVELGKTQDDIAAEAGVNRSQVSLWERGIAYPRSDRVTAAARAYSLTRARFLALLDEAHAHAGREASELRQVIQ